MELDLQISLPTIIVTFILGIGAIAFLAMGMKRFSRFFMMDYQGNSKERYKDNLIGNVFIGLGVGCLVSVIFALQEGTLSWALLPLSLCFSVFIIPIGILGAYWRSYLTNKLWGGFMPTVREKYGFTQPVPAKQNRINPSKIKIPRRTTITAFLIALLVSFGVYFILGMIDWNGSPLSGLLFRLFVSGLTAFGIFMTIISAALSRKVQNLRNGERLDNDDDF